MLACHLSKCKQFLSKNDKYLTNIVHSTLSKAKSLLKLKEDYVFDRLVVFGDSLNDISMFKIADESYAVSNARDELKELATQVIGYNEEDSVAHFLESVMEESLKIQRKGHSATFCSGK